MTVYRLNSARVLALKLALWQRRLVSKFMIVDFFFKFPQSFNYIAWSILEGVNIKSKS